MNGHLDIIKMRLDRMKPDYVFLNDFPCKTDWLEFGDYATVSIGPTEAVEMLDLRFLSGLKVSVASPSESRAKALYLACKDAGAKTVAASHVKSLQDLTGWADVYHAPEGAI